MKRRSARALAGVALAGVLLLAGVEARRSLGIELSTESVRSWVAGFGWKGPAVYVGLVVCRPLLMLPSWVVLSTGGLVFGMLPGALLGALGITLSGFLSFGIARSVGGDWLTPRLGPELGPVRARVEHAGAWLVGLGTAHPAVPLTVFHVAGGLSPLSVLSFALALIPGSLFRAGSYSAFGATLSDPGTPAFFLASAFLIGVGALPLAHRGLRQRLFGAGERS